MMGYDGGYGLMGGFGWLGMLLVWALVIGLVVWATTGLFGSRGASDNPADALAILKRRFAAGEITEAEFETARRALA